jgi:hypothetical protein
MTKSEWGDAMRGLPPDERAAILRKTPDAVTAFGHHEATILLAADAEVAREAAAGRTIEHLAAKQRVLGRLIRRIKLADAAAPKKKAVAGERFFTRGETVFLAAGDPDAQVVVSDERPEDPPTADPQGDEYYEATIEEIAAAKAQDETIDFMAAAKRVYAKKGDRG